MFYCARLTGLSFGNLWPFLLFIESILVAIEFLKRNMKLLRLVILTSCYDELWWNALFSWSWFSCWADTLRRFILKLVSCSEHFISGNEISMVVARSLSEVYFNISRGNFSRKLSPAFGYFFFENLFYKKQCKYGIHIGVAQIRGALNRFFLEKVLFYFWVLGAAFNF